MTADQSSSPPPASAGSYLRLLLRALLHRRDLAAMETAEAGHHLLKTVIAAACAFGLLLLTGLTLTFAIAAAVWHLEDRGLILAGLAAFYLLVAAILTRWVKSRFRTWTPLAATRTQLRADGELLSDLFPEN